MRWFEERVSYIDAQNCAEGYYNLPPLTARAEVPLAVLPPPSNTVPRGVASTRRELVASSGMVADPPTGDAAAEATAARAAHREEGAPLGAPSLLYAGDVLLNDGGIVAAEERSTARHGRGRGRGAARGQGAA